MRIPTRRILPKRVNENHVDDVVVVRKRHHDPVGVDIPTARFGKWIVRKPHTALLGNLAIVFGHGLAVVSKVGVPDPSARRIEAAFLDDIRPHQPISKPKRLVEDIDEDHVR